MSVAKCLGVDDLDGPQMRDVRARWPQWSEVEPVLGLVDDPVALPKLMRRLEPAQRDEVLTALVRLGVVETEATVALVWLLVPGASRLARRIGVCRSTSTSWSPASSGSKVGSTNPRTGGTSRPRSSSTPSER